MQATLGFEPQAGSILQIDLSLKYDYNLLLNPGTIFSAFEFTKAVIRFDKI